MGVTVDLGSVVDLLNGAEQKIEEAVRPGLESVGIFLESKIKPVTPYKIGRLRESIGWDMTGPLTAEVGVLHPKDGKVLIYAPYVEFGTRYITPRLYVTGTVAKNQQRAFEIMRQQILKALGTE